MFKKKSIMAAAAFMMTVSLLGTNGSAQAAGFVDVPNRTVKEVTYLAEGGIANGSSELIFGSEKKVTRLEAAAFIGRALQLNGTTRKTNFLDVSSNNFASGYIQSAVEKGILSGYDGGRFLPAKEVSRGEMAVMISKAFGYPFGGSLSGAANALVSRGIASGMEDGTFGSNQIIKRADFAVFLARAVNPAFRLKQSDVASLTRWTNTGNLNVRSGPSTSFASIGKLAANTQVTVLQQVGGWSYIRAGQLTGFVSTSYLRSTETGGATVTPAPTPAPAKAPAPSTASSILASETIIIDPGHGGKDPGAIGFGLREKDVALTTSLKVTNLIKKTPLQVKMTRSDDRYITINDRAAFAKKNGGDLFVSIHANAAVSPNANGTETLYYAAANGQNTADSKLLAAKIQDRMMAAWGLSNRGIKARDNLGVLKNNSVPAALAELGFITNKGDNDKLKSDYWLDKMSKAIYDGILDYYKAKGYDVNSFYSVGK